MDPWNGPQVWVGKFFKRESPFSRISIHYGVLENFPNLTGHRSSNVNFSLDLLEIRWTMSDSVFSAHCMVITVIRRSPSCCTLLRLALFGDLTHQHGELDENGTKTCSQLDGNIILIRQNVHFIPPVNFGPNISEEEMKMLSCYIYFSSSDPRYIFMQDKMGYLPNTTLS